MSDSDRVVCPPFVLMLFWGGIAVGAALGYRLTDGDPRWLRVIWICTGGVLGGLLGGLLPLVPAIVRRARRLKRRARRLKVPPKH